MHDMTTLSQADVDYLFKIDFGTVDEIPLEVAGRLHLLKYVQELSPLTGTRVTGTHRDDLYIGVSPGGRALMAAIRDGVERRWVAWPPSIHDVTIGV
ncbi:hypothetical protein [Dyella japonica]|uniref:Uncharacterized protein n=1 Tax=Dyella japonica TaxID=231455 RepID=A0ABV2K126_9GAMM